MKNILLATTGTSPQVLTETLYAIAQSGRPFPDKVFVITTKNSKDILLNGLLNQGHLQALQQEYDLPPIQFDESHVWLIEDDKGQFIEDAKSIEDQTYMADFITRKVFELTQDDNCAIHASLAGGRKTMAFYFGYAMSMFGRSQDTLSHVFVNDEFEFVKDFWFPTKHTNIITGKYGKGELDTKLAEVTLAEIPFVRMRHAIDSKIIASMSNQSFSQTVGMLNASHNEELEININKKSKIISTLGVDVRLTAKELAFFLWLYQKGEEGILVDRYFEQEKQYSIEFLNCFYQLASDPRVFNSFNTTPEDFKEQNYDDLQGMEKEFLQPICSSINSKLNKALPSEVAIKLQVRSLSEKQGQRYKVDFCERNRNKINIIE